jgi:hypothetical protein
MLRKSLLLSAALLALGHSTLAYDVYRITNRGTLVTRYHEDLLSLINLNAHSVQSVPIWGQPFTYDRSVLWSSPSRAGFVCSIHHAMMRQDGLQTVEPWRS